MPSQIKQKVMDARASLREIFSYSEQSQTEDRIEQLSDSECEELLEQLKQKVEKPRLPIGDI